MSSPAAPVLLAGDKRIAIFQTFFDEQSRKRLHPDCIPMYAFDNNEFLENASILELVRGDAHKIADYVGLFSWRFFEKIPLTPLEILQRIQEDQFSSPIYSFFGALDQAYIWRNAEVKHPGIIEAAQCLLSRLDLSLDLEELQAPVVYQNHFICRPEVLGEYCSSMLEPAISAMRKLDDIPLQRLLHIDAGYHDHEKPREKMELLYGQRFPTMAPFICERLLSTWVTTVPGKQYQLEHIWSGGFIHQHKKHLDPEIPPIESVQWGGLKKAREQSGDVVASIVVTTYGRETWYTQMCLQRIAEWKTPHHELIVVVHDESLLLRAYLYYLKQLGFIDVLLLAEAGHGHVRGVNLGMAHASGEFVFNICIDMLVGPGLLDECTERLRGNPELGAIGWHYHWAADYPGAYWIDGQLHCRERPEEKDIDCRDEGELSSEYINIIKQSRWFSGKIFKAIGHRRILCFNGSFFGVRRDIWQQVDGLDELNCPHTWADDLLYYAILDSGYSIANINPLYGGGEHPDLCVSYSELKWLGQHDPNRHRDELEWMPWFSAPGLSVNELNFFDLIVRKLHPGAPLAWVGDPEQSSSFGSLEFRLYPTSASLPGIKGGYALIINNGREQVKRLQGLLAPNGWLIVLPAFADTAGLPYHCRLGVYMNSPDRLKFVREFPALNPVES